MVTETQTDTAPRQRWGDHRGGEVCAVEVQGSRLLIVLRLPTGEVYTRSIACSSSDHAHACRHALMWLERLA